MYFTSSAFLFVAISTVVFTFPASGDDDSVLYERNIDHLTSPDQDRRTNAFLTKRHLGATKHLASTGAPLFIQLHPRTPLARGGGGSGGRGGVAGKVKPASSASATKGDKDKPGDGKGKGGGGGGGGAGKGGSRPVTIKQGGKDIAKSVKDLFNELISDTYKGFSVQQQRCFAWGDGHKPTIPLGDGIVVHVDDMPKGMLTGDYSYKPPNRRRDVYAEFWWDDGVGAGDDDDDDVYDDYDYNEEQEETEEDEKDKPEEPSHALSARKDTPGSKKSNGSGGGCYWKQLPHHRSEYSSRDDGSGYVWLPGCQKEHNQNLQDDATRKLGEDNLAKAQKTIDDLKANERKQKTGYENCQRKMDANSELRPMQGVGRGAGGAEVGNGIAAMAFEGDMNSACKGTLKARVMTLGCYDIASFKGGK